MPENLVFSSDPYDGARNESDLNFPSNVTVPDLQIHRLPIWDVLLPGPTENELVVPLQPGVESRYTLIDPSRDIIYITTNDGRVLRYDMAADLFLTAIEIGGTLQDMALSRDGNTLVVADSDFTGEDGFSNSTLTQFHTVDLQTLAVTTIEYVADGFGEAGSVQISVDANDTVLLTGFLTGSGPTLLRRFEDLGQGDQILPMNEFAFSFSSPATLDTTRDGLFTLVVESNTSGVGHHIYSTETGDLVASGSLFNFESSRFGFNRDLNAISAEAERVVLTTTGNNIFLLNFNLELVADLSNFQLSGNVAGNVFSDVGNLLFMWDTQNNTLIAYDHTRGELVSEINLESSINQSAGFFVFNSNDETFGDLILSGDGTTLVFDTGNAFEILDLSDFANELALELIGTTGADSLHGDLGNDTLVGKDGDDFLHGEAGDDRLLAGRGDDEVDGGSGNDFILGGSGDDRLFGGEGNDEIDGQANDDLIEGGAGRDRLSGGNGNDILRGGEGRDFLFGNDGNDRLEGGMGNDYLGGASGNDLLIGGLGADRLYGGSGRDRLFGQQDDDIIFGGAGDDQVVGGAGNDFLQGQNGDDVLSGGTGRDILTGGRGNDELNGGAGEDIFVVGRQSEVDFITDFTVGEDFLDLTDFSEAEIQSALDNAPSGVSIGPASGPSVPLTVLTFGSDDTELTIILLVDVSPDQITSDDIIGLDDGAMI